MVLLVSLQGCDSSCLLGHLSSAAAAMGGKVEGNSMSAGQLHLPEGGVLDLSNKAHRLMALEMAGFMGSLQQQMDEDKEAEVSACCFTWMKNMPFVKCRNSFFWSPWQHWIFLSVWITCQCGRMGPASKRVMVKRNEELMFSKGSAIDTSDQECGCVTCPSVISTRQQLPTCWVVLAIRFCISCPWLATPRSSVLCMCCSRTLMCMRAHLWVCKVWLLHMGGITPWCLKPGPEW